SPEDACVPCLCFFFQAEDGIRDLIVTGVQTCALPISNVSGTATIQAGQTSFVIHVPILYDTIAEPLESFRFQITNATNAALIRRSEERRVGKECRSRGAAEHLKKKK